GVASEGSFGPHPQIPFVPIDSELVMLVDRRDGVEIIGTHVTPRTNYAQRVVADARLAVAFAEGIGFPRHGVIVTAAVDGKSHPALLLRKDNLSRAQLLANVADAIAISGAACVETDMRACSNPTRIRANRTHRRPAVRGLSRTHRHDPWRGRDLRGLWSSPRAIVRGGVGRSR